MQVPTDEDLIDAFVRGDQAAFTAIVDRYGGRLRGYAFRLLRNHEQAEEVFAETFLRVATGAARFERRGTVRGWLFTMAHRMCLDILRRRKVALEAVPGMLALGTARPLTPSPEAVVALGEMAGAIEQALQELSEEHRQVVLLRLVNELSAAEVAAVMGSTESQVHSQLSYARKLLVQRLGAADDPQTAKGRP